MRIYKATMSGILLMMLLGIPSIYGQAKAAPNAQQKQAAPNAQQIERGRYIIAITGCNHCHTAGWEQAGGDKPERERLLGDTTGNWGPWGTTYATNLRLSLSMMTEDQWVKYAKILDTRPPMPWFNVRPMTETDLRAIYQYIRSLGPVGKEAPAFLPPGKQPKPPFIQFPGAK